jgi:hypothetical protein
LGMSQVTWLITREKIAHYPAVNFLQRGFSMYIHDLAGDTPNTVNTSVTRTRRYLTGREVERLIEAARKARSIRPPGRDHDPDRLPAWASGFHPGAWLGSGTRTSSTRCAIPSCHRIGSRTSGDRGGPVNSEQFRSAPRTYAAFQNLGGWSDDHTRIIRMRDRCASCPVSQFIAKPMVSKMNTEVRPTRTKVSIRSERTIRADLS